MMGSLGTTPLPLEYTLGSVLPLRNILLLNNNANLVVETYHGGFNRNGARIRIRFA